MNYATALVAALLLAASAGTAHAQAAAPKTAKTAKTMHKASPEYCTLKGGKMMLMKNGKLEPLTADMTMTDGSVCMTDGTCKTKDGTATKMKEGECMLMNGRMTMHPTEHMGHKKHHPKAAKA